MPFITYIIGNCSCLEGYGASDCSINLAVPPRIESLLDGGLCDERKTPCSFLYVFGEVFIGNEVICRLLEFQVNKIFLIMEYILTHVKNKFGFVI